MTPIFDVVLQQLWLSDDVKVKLIRGSEQPADRKSGG